MPRTHRNLPKDVTQHIIKRAHNRQPCFLDDEDRITFLTSLTSNADKYQVAVHAWVLMSNHVHLLCTPITNTALSSMMKATSQAYTQHYNAKYDSCGTIWESRFKSAAVEDERYLLELYRYIELNPVRAELVLHARSYRWSSVHTNAYGKSSVLTKPHQCYLALSKDKIGRVTTYRELLEQGLQDQQINELRHMFRRKDEERWAVKGSDPKGLTPLRT